MSLDTANNDTLGRPLSVGDTVVFALPNDRGLKLGTVVTVSPIRLTIEFKNYNNDIVRIDRNGRHTFKIK